MLSSTYTIIDVKAKLENTYSFYGYASDALFTTGLTSISEDVYRIYFLPRLGEDEYNVIKAKNRAGLTEFETNVYWAEVYTICCEFLKSRSAKTQQLQMNTNEMLSVEGYKYQTATGKGSSQGDLSMKYYKDKMFWYWKLAGWNIMALERTCTIFGDSLYPDVDRTIIE